jgi:hypothetical protein
LTDDEKDVWVFIRESDKETLLVALTPSFKPFNFAFPEGEWETIFETAGGRVCLKK